MILRFAAAESASVVVAEGTQFDAIESGATKTNTIRLKLTTNDYNYKLIPARPNLL